MYKFLHAADIHLDSPLLNLERYDGAPVETFRSATRRALDNLVELAITEQVRFLLIAGDLYDGDCRDSNTPLHLRQQMRRLAEQRIQVFICQGNHDFGMRKEFRLSLPDNVHLFRTDRPETVRIEELRVAIHGQGFSQRDVTEDLSDRYPRPVAGWLNVGLLHSSCGAYEAHDSYAPSSILGLSNKGYHYWALGHIHQRQHLAGPNPWIVYPGNTQGRHIREDGPKGCELVTVEDGEISAVQPRAVDVLRWQRCLVDAKECEEAEDVLAAAQTAIEKLVAAAEDRPLAVRIEVEGATAAHRSLMRHPDHWDRRLREAMVDYFDSRVWVEKIKLRTRPIEDLSALEDRDDAFGQLLAGIRDAAAFGPALAEVRDEFQQLLKHVPTDPRSSHDRIDLDDAHINAALLGEVRELLIGRLLESGEQT